MKRNKIFSSKLLWAIFLILSIITGCSDKNVLDEDKFIKVYADLIITQDTASFSGMNIDSVKEQVYKRNNITDMEYKATLHYYNQEPERWGKFFTKAIAYVENLKKGGRKKQVLKSN